MAELVNSSVLEQTKLRICDAAARNDLHIHLNALSGAGHLLVRLWLVSLFRLWGWEHFQFPHDSKEVLWAARVSALPQAAPQLDHTQRWISTAHIPDEFQLLLRMLVWMIVRPSGLAGQRRFASVPALFPEVDI